MTQATAALSYADAAGFALIGILAVVTWLRRRGRTRACLAAAFGLLGAVSALGQLSSVIAAPVVVSTVSLICFMGSGYALVELRHTLLPLARRARLAVVTLLCVITVLALPITVQGHMGKPGRYVWLVASALILGWVACVVEPAIRFRIAARSQPVVQRNRLRALSTGYLGIAIALVLALGAAAAAAAASAKPSPEIGLGLQLVSTAVIPLFYVGFAPPTWLRRSWRYKEADVPERE